GETTRLTESPEDQLAQSWHPGERLLAFTGTRGGTGQDLMILPMEGDAVRGLLPGKPTVFLSTPTDESAPEFSPDGRFIAYVSTESLGADIYVRPFPGPAGKWRISTSGGIHPRWSATSHELLFENQNQILAAPYSVVGDSFRPEKPRLWSKARHRSSGNGTPYPYDIHPDGKRLAIRAAPGEEGSGGPAQDKVVFFFGFGEYLKKIAPVGK
ncbi:MAG: PD40 domain-containing protein, partial [Vicinamibacteria bacterium]|nr:PD40 domain-containing protein [Vicinamibacteria bacterium]